MSTPAPPATSAQGRRTLRGVSAIRAFFRTNKTPIYFVSPTPFNLLGVDRWVRNFTYVNYYETFSGGHPRTFVPSEREPRDFQSMEEMNNYLLSHAEVFDLVRRKGSGKAVFVMFDEQTEALASQLGLQMALPSAALRRHLDSKLVTTRLGNEAGVPSVPNVLGRASSYEELLALASGAGLGDDLVVQLAWGDSGKTTFFVASQEDWDKAVADNPGLLTEEFKAMKRIRCRAVAVEAVLTRHGTLVGPIMTDLTGHRELTPYRGGWCGNDVFPEALDETQRQRARVLTQNLGERLASEGFRGFFEVDYLVDLDTGELYLGELNPRLSGITSMTNVTAAAYADLPLFLFHLLEYMDVDYEIDVSEINERWAEESNVDNWSQVVFKHIDDGLQLITEAPETGVWKSERRGQVRFSRPASDWHDLYDDTEAFYLRISGPGDYLYKGADLGILVIRGRLQDDRSELTPLCRRWVNGLKAQFAAVPVETAAPQPPPAGSVGVKST